MRNIKSSIHALALLLVVMLASNAQAIESIQLDEGIPADQAESIQYDQNYLSKLQFQGNETDQATQKLLGISEALNAKVLSFG